MAKDDLIQIDGTIEESHAHGHFSVLLDNQKKVTAKLSGKMRKFYIRVVVGDRVTVGFSPYDTTNGLILFRHKDQSRNT
jgi:translation initiation factor IF-1